jgi:pyruvate ferredoxin oxidoreductase beta subunit
MTNLKELSKRPERLVGGHRLCAGCGASIAVRQILLGTDQPVVAAVATGCLEVATTIYPYTAWNIPFIHNAFENVAATLSGAETAGRALKAKDRLPGKREPKFIAFGGDGGTYDIGLQSLSGALERGHDLVYVCYDNEAYMNTGIQRSGATPSGASTTTAPAGTQSTGKPEYRKDLTRIVAAHDVPYAAQSTIGFWKDMVSKSEKAFQTPGPAFLNVLSMCHRGWRFAPEDTIEISKLAVETCFWPLYEIEHGQYRLNYRPEKKLPITAWMKPQGRFKHLFSGENAPVIADIQQEVDQRWAQLLSLCGEPL